jgi:hypothetical protein
MPRRAKRTASTPAPKRGAGRPSLGAAAKRKVVLVRFTALQHSSIKARVTKPGTVSSWVRDRALEPLGLAQPSLEEE